MSTSTELTLKPSIPLRGTTDLIPMTWGLDQETLTLPRPTPAQHDSYLLWCRDSLPGKLYHTPADAPYSLFHHILKMQNHRQYEIAHYKGWEMLKKEFANPSGGDFKRLPMLLVALLCCTDEEVGPLEFHCLSEETHCLIPLNTVYRELGVTKRYYMAWKIKVKKHHNDMRQEWELMGIQDNNLARALYLIANADQDTPVASIAPTIEQESDDEDEDVELSDKCECGGYYEYVKKCTSCSDIDSD